jgi:hypothetical protein
MIFLKNQLDHEISHYIDVEVFVIVIEAHK